MSNKEESHWPLFLGLIIVAIIVIYIIILIVQGTIAFFSSEGVGTWLIVIGCLALFVLLVMNADR